MKALFLKSAVVAALCVIERSHATVVFMPLSSPYYLGHRPDDVGATIHLFDLDGDSKNDVLFGNSGFALVAATSETDAIIHWPAFPPDTGGEAAVLQAGTLIGADPSLIVPRLIWETGNSAMIWCFNIGCAGLWHNQTGYLGVRFERSDGTHFGYLNFEADLNYNGGWLHGWAWETEPDREITVVPIPEPATIAFLSIGGALILRCRRRSARGGRFD